MRSVFLIFFCAVFFFSCTHDSIQKQETMPEEMKSQALDLSAYSNHKIVLINGLGSISVYLPNTMDTFYTYTDFGEYHCGETKQFRFSGKKYNPGHATDFSYSDPADSLYQLTISQTYNKDCETYITIDDTMLKTVQKDKSKTYTMLDVRGKKIIVGVHEAQSNDMDIAQIDALTAVSGRQIRFVFQCFKKSSDGFVNQALTSLKTLVVKEDTNGALRVK